MIARGSIVLFKSSGKWYEQAIAYATRGPFVHVEVAYVGGLTIGAHPHGITTSPAPINTNTYTAIDITPYTTQEKIEAALAWLEQQIGDEYGTMDIVYQAVKFLFPNNKLQWGVEGHYDCSDLACRYLLLAGVSMPASYLNCYSVTPNDLARWANLIPRREGVSYA